MRTTPDLDPIPLQSADGLVFWRRAEVAMLRDEYLGRLEATSARGDVAHRPGPLDAISGPPFVEISPGTLINFAHARREGDVLALPGDWRVPCPPEIHPPTWPAPPTEVPLAGSEVLPSEVLYLQGREGRAWWHTDRGPVAAGPSAEGAAPLHPTLAKAGRGTYVNYMRLRQIRPEHKRFRLVLDNGAMLTVSWGARAALAEGLGLPHLYYLEPRQHESLYLEDLRDWPWELYHTPAMPLQAALGKNERRCMANTIWQVFRWRQRGTPAVSGTTLRGFWYRPVQDVAMRAGFFNAGDVAEITDADEIAAQRAIGEIGARAMLDSIERARGGDRHYSLFLALLAAMVGDYRLFDYTDLGLKEPRPDLRRIGTTHPDVVLVAEKRELDQATDLLGERDDISTLIMGGIPSLLSTEYFAKALRTAHVSTITLIAYVDFDPGGWIAISGLVGQLRRYGVHVRHVGYLIRPERFTENEIDLHAYSVSSTDPQIDGKVKAWVAESGGIHGQERGIHADVMPVARVLAAYQEEIRATRKPINGGNI